VPSRSYLIIFAILAAVFGVAVWILERRRGERLAGLAGLLGIPGVYVAGLASWGGPRWLYVPGVSLMAAAVLVQVLGWRRQASRSDIDEQSDHAGEKLR
jgi:hypothetical protein